MAVTDEILDVDTFSKDDDGCWAVFCPHCKRVMELEPGPVRGEQYKDPVCGEQYKNPVCGGWLEVTFDAKCVANIHDKN